MTTRRDFLQTTAAAGMTMALPMGAQAQAGEGIRLGLLTVKTGPLASGGIDMEKLKQLADLHTAGILSDEEFTAAKAKVLADA